MSVTLVMRQRLKKILFSVTFFMRQFDGNLQHLLDLTFVLRSCNMGCIVEFTEPHTRIELFNNQKKQKLLIDVLLTYGKLDINGLADALNVSVGILYTVHHGDAFLVNNDSDNLMQLFLLFFGE